MGRAGRLAPLARVPDVRLFSLQMGPGRADLTAGRDFEITDLSSDFDAESLADAAAAISNLDLVVTVDTAPAHLAGALGVPVSVALATNADWRWLRGSRGFPWYPTMHLFRQSRAGQWSDVFGASPARWPVGSPRDRT